MPFTRMKRIFLQGLLWLYLLGFGYMALSLNAPEFLDFDNLPDTNFSCVGKVIGGYYADLETNCQMFHVCTIGQLDEPMDIRFLCLNGTVFDQETRVCERIDEVDCAKSERFYSLNLELYGNSQPSILEESAETEPPLIIKSTAAPSTTTTRTTTTPRPTPKTTRAAFFTTISPKTKTTPRQVQHHHFPSGVNSNSPDIRFNPEEINISLNPGAPPDIRTKPLSFSSSSDNNHNKNININSNSNNKAIVNEESQENEQILSHQESDSLRIPLTTIKPKSVVSYGLTHNNNQQQHHQQSVTPADINFGFTFHQDEEPEYQTEPEHNYHYNSNFRPSFQFKPSTYRNDYNPTTLRNRYQPKPTTIRPHFLQLQSLKPPNLQAHHYHQQLRTEKPQRLQLPLPLLPTLSPLTFSSPAPFSLPRHIEIKRYTKDHQEPPRIIISASASVSDNSGRRLNYSLGQIGAAQILDQPPQSYDEYKDSDVGLDPFYHDVPKVKHRNKRSPQKHFDIIKNEQEAVDVLKFLFEWYKSHEQTSTSTFTIPISPKVITEINDELSSPTIETPIKVDRTHIESTTTLSTKFSRGRRRYNNRGRGRSRFNDHLNNTHVEQHDIQTSTTEKHEIIADEIYHEPQATIEHRNDQQNYHLESVMQEEYVTTPKQHTEIVDTVTLPNLRSIVNQNQDIPPVNYEEYDLPETTVSEQKTTQKIPESTLEDINIGEQIFNEHKEQITTHLEEDYTETNIPITVNTEPYITNQENITTQSVEPQVPIQETTANLEPKQVHITPKSFRGYSAFNSKLYEAIHLLKDYIGEVKTNITSQKEKVHKEVVPEPIKGDLDDIAVSELQKYVEEPLNEEPLTGLPQEPVQEPIVAQEPLTQYVDTTQVPIENVQEPIHHDEESQKPDIPLTEPLEQEPIHDNKEVTQKQEIPIITEPLEQTMKPTSKRTRGRKTFKSQLLEAEAELIEELKNTMVTVLPEIAEEIIMKEKMANVQDITITSTTSTTSTTTQEPTPLIIETEPVETTTPQRSRNSRRRGRPTQKQITDQTTNNNNNRRRRGKKKQSTTPPTLLEESVQKKTIVEAESIKETTSTKDNKEDFLSLATSSNKDETVVDELFKHEEDYVNDNYEPSTYVAPPPKEFVEEIKDKQNTTILKENRDYEENYSHAEVISKIDNYIKELNTEYSDYNDVVQPDHTVNITDINNLFNIETTITSTTSTTTTTTTTERPSRGKTTFSQYLEVTNSPIDDTTPTTPLSHLTSEMIATPSISTTASSLDYSTTESLTTAEDKSTEQYTSSEETVKTTGTEERFVVDDLVPENITISTLDETVKVPKANSTDNNTMVMPLQEYVKDIEESTGSIATSVATKNNVEKLTEIESTSLMDYLDESSTLDENDSTTDVQDVSPISTTTEPSTTVSTTTTHASTTLSTTTPVPQRSGRRRTYSRKEPTSYNRHRFSTLHVTQRTPFKKTTLEQDILESLKSKTNAYEATVESTSPKNVPIKTEPVYKSEKKILTTTEMFQRKLIFNCFDKKLNHFYPDARDCRLFHYCTNGFTKNQLLDMKFVCDSNTFFDSDKLICTKVKPERCL